MSDFANIEAAIRQLHARYCDAVWRKDIAAFGDCFAKDAEWRIGGQETAGDFPGGFSTYTITDRQTFRDNISIIPILGLRRRCQTSMLRARLTLEWLHGITG